MTKRRAVMPDEKTPGHGLQGKDRRQGDLRDVHGGTYDPPSESAPPEINEHRTGRQDEQSGADVRPDTTPRQAGLPQGLRHRTGPMNKSSGRRTPDSGENERDT
jgi:hypothetical protein